MVLAWFGVVFWTAVAARAAPAWTFPDASIVVIAFLALRRNAVWLLLVALSVGYLLGRAALAPVGLHETALAVSAFVLYLTSGRLAGGGAFFFALISGAAVILFHLLLLLLLLLFRGHVGFSSWSTALLIPSAVATGALALVAYRPMSWLEKKLSPERREGLQWT